MDTNVMQQVLDELFPALEALETQSGAMMEFLRGKTSDRKLRLLTCLIARYRRPDSWFWSVTILSFRLHQMSSGTPFVASRRT